MLVPGRGLKHLEITELRALKEVKERKLNPRYVELADLGLAVFKKNHLFGLSEQGAAVLETNEWLSLVTQGTTTRTDELELLWVGDHIALVKRRAGGYSTAGGWNYSAPMVHVVDIAEPRRQTSVWDCSRKGDGRLTKKRLAGVIAEVAPQDKTWAEDKVRVQAELDAERKVEDARNAEDYRLLTDIRDAESTLLGMVMEAETDEPILASARAYKRKRLAYTAFVEKEE